MTGANMPPTVPDLRALMMAQAVDRAIFMSEDSNVAITASYLTGDPHYYCRHTAGKCLVKAFHEGGYRAIRSLRR